MSAVEDVDVARARELVDQGGVLLDVREPNEWSAGHAPGATHIRMGDLGARQAEIPTDATIVAVCRSGGRSAQAASAMARAGYDVVNLAGGMQAWAQHGLPVVSGDGGPGRIV